MKEDDFEALLRERDEFLASPGVVVENRMRAVAMIRRVVLANLAELRDPVLAFEDPAVYMPLMDVDHGQRQLDQFLVHVTRRLFNHLVTSASCVDHLRMSVSAMPAEQAACFGRLSHVLHQFASRPHFALLVALRDFCVHNWLHVTAATLDLNPPMRARVALSLVRIREEFHARRRRRSSNLTDPFVALGDRLEMGTLVATSHYELTALFADLTSILSDEYKRYADEVRVARERLSKLLGSG